MKLVVKEKQIRSIENLNFVSLTDIWKTSGKGSNYSPSKWLRQKTTYEFLTALKKKIYDKLGIHSPNFIVSKRGMGTYAHPLVALAYASYLNQ